MSTVHVNAQEISDIHTSLYCGYAVFALLVYDWLLCLGQEATFIWSWHSKATGSSLVYAFTRYSVLISNILSILTAYPMSDLRYPGGRHSTIGWSLIVVTILSTIAFSAFSALRAYALSDRNLWLSGIIIGLALPPPMMTILQGTKSGFQNLPRSPPTSNSSNATTFSVNLVSRAAQLAAELLVVAITGWYTYQSYHVWKDSLKLGRSLSSLLIYNGCIYFLFFATWYVLDIILNAAPVSPKALHVDDLLVSTFYDPITSILICRFILALRQFNSRTASATYCSRVSGLLVTRPVLDFSAQPSETLPGFIAPFSRPVHTGLDPSEADADSDASVDYGY
ncbi:hypothetical protein V8D89_001286 [Ganoderma adspersum]